MPRNNYSFVVDSSFQPFSMQEMLAPLALYKEEYEKREEAYTDLTDKADKFKYLSETLPEGSQARKIYEGYANELNKQANDLAQNGLNMGNRRALINLKRRYQGEIGKLVSADEALQEERKLRRTMNAKDSSMLYALDNLSIDSFLDGNTPNLYNISGTELYTRGAAAGKAASSRVYNAGDEGSTLNGYYRKWVERNGYSKESIDAFRANAAAIPELQQAADDILLERGVYDNLEENPQALQRARQSVLNGIIDGAVYAESVKPVRDESRMSAAQAASNALGWANHNLSVAAHGMVKDKDGRYVSNDEWMYTHDDNGRRNGFSPEYEEAVKKGLVPGKNIKIGSDVRPTTTTTQTGRQGTRKPKANMYFTQNGTQTFTNKDGRRLGTQITYAEAITKFPEIGMYVGNDTDLYDYWDSGVGVYITGNGPERNQATQQSEEATITTGDNDQL